MSQFVVTPFKVCCFALVLWVVLLVLSSVGVLLLLFFFFFPVYRISVYPTLCFVLVCGHNSSQGNQHQLGDHRADHMSPLNWLDDCLPLSSDMWSWCQQWIHKPWCSCYVITNYLYLFNRFRSKVKFAPWSCGDSVKIGLCSVPPPGLTASVLSLVNTSNMVSLFKDVALKFNKLYKRKVMYIVYVYITNSQC